MGDTGVVLIDVAGEEIPQKLYDEVPVDLVFHFSNGAKRPLAGLKARLGSDGVKPKIFLNSSSHDALEAFISELGIPSDRAKDLIASCNSAVDAYFKEKSRRHPVPTSK